MVRGAVAIGLAIALGTCAREVEAPVALRFVPADPQELFTVEMLREERLYASWTDPFTSPDWRVVDAIPAADRGTAVLALDSTVDTAAVDTLTVELTLPGPIRPAERRVELSWRPAAGPLSSRPRAAARLAPGAGDARSMTARIALRGLPRWIGEVRDLQLEFPARAEEVQAIELLSEAWTEGAIAQAGSGWRIAMGNDVRTALPGPPGLEVQRKLRVAHGARLRFAYAVLGGSPIPVDFRVLFRSDDGPEIVLFEERLPAAGEAAWRDAEVELTAVANRSGNLVLSTEAQLPLHPTMSIPLWGHPEVIVPDADRRPNVVLVSIDTLRADRMSLYGYSRSTTPRLDAWSADAAVFERTISQSSWTLPSHVSMLTGLDPFHHGVNHSNQTIPPQHVLLAERLRAAGYRTLAVTGGTLLHPRYGFARGFDRYWHFDDNRAKGDELGVELERAISWIEHEGDAPFFLFFHTYEVHTPFRARSPFYESFTDLPRVEDVRNPIPDASATNGYRWRSDVDDLEVVRPASFPSEDRELVLAATSVAYDSGVAYVDRELPRLFAAVEARGLADRTVFVLTSDHGELLGEHGGLVNHRYVVDENVHIPLVIKAPQELRRGVRISAQVRSVDIVPTLLELVGLEPEDNLQGRSLVPFLESGSGSPRDAWTYVPETNYGLALRTASGGTYSMNDTAWLVAEEPTAPLDEVTPAGDEELATVRGRMQDAVASLPGLRLRLVNSGPEPFSGIIRGPAAKFNVVKAIDAPAGSLDYSPWNLRFTAPASTEYTVFFSPGAELELTLELAGDVSPLVSDMTRSDLLTGAVFGLDAGAWRPVRGTRRPTAYIEIGWEGELPREQTVPAVDEDLRRRLHALGYIR